ncbi:MAG TPA: ABC transporter permease, partial [Thermodesulfobacteriota bacterium]|nr:ABC transporter permease [Thermodesulfobacteriota bacterium]
GVLQAELQKVRHDPVELITRAVQPLLWLVLFGEVMARVRGISPGNLSYIDYLSAGILAQSVLFVAIFFGISAIWDRDLGILHRMLVSPAPRTSIVMGKAFAASFSGFIQGVIVYSIAGLLGADLSFSPLHIFGVVVLIALGCGLFSTLSLIIACLVKTRERFMGIGQLLTMPVFFASNAIYPISLMPDWLRTVSSLNPLTYQVDAMRSLMITGVKPEFGLPFDFFILTVITGILIIIAGRLYPRMAV